MTRGDTVAAVALVFGGLCLVVAMVGWVADLVARWVASRERARRFAALPVSCRTGTCRSREHTHPVHGLRP